jgi:hypothetical protein
MEITSRTDWEDFAQMPGDTPQERAAAISEDLIRGACSYPGLTRAHFYDLVAEGSEDTLAVEKINEFVQHLVVKLREMGSRLEEAELRLAVAQIMSAVLVVSLYRLFSKSFGIDMHDEKARREFVQRLVERLL